MKQVKRLRDCDMCEHLELVYKEANNLCPKHYEGYKRYLANR